MNGHRRRNATTSPQRPRRPKPVVAPPRLKTSDPLDAVKWWKKRVDAPLFVYFIQDGDDGPVKIGKALNPASRLAELQCGNPRPLTLRAVVLAAIDTESSLHAMWRFACMRGEWFGGDDQHTIIALAVQCQRTQIDTYLGKPTTHLTTQIPAAFIRPTGVH